MISSRILTHWSNSFVMALGLTFLALILAPQNSAQAFLQVEVKGEIQQDSSQESAEDSDTQEDDTEDVSTGLDFLNAGTAPSSLDQLRAMEAHVARLTEDVSPATVNIRVGQGQGSGVVISSDGYILTAAHVIGTPGQTAIVTFPVSYTHLTLPTIYSV